MTKERCRCHRNVAAVRLEDGSVYLGWRLRSKDGPGTAFHVERRLLGGPWTRATERPVLTCTNWVNPGPVPQGTEYRVVSETTESEAAVPAPGPLGAGVALRSPLRVPGRQCSAVCAGDLDNDGRTDFVVRSTDGDRLLLDAYRGDGRPLWRLDTHLPARGGWDGSTLHCPFALWDVNGDGRTEVVFHRRPDRVSYPEGFYAGALAGETLAAADGETGEVIWEAPWPGTRPRVMLTVGHLRASTVRRLTDHPELVVRQAHHPEQRRRVEGRGLGEPAAVVVLDETYGDVLLTAVDGRDGSTLWQVRQGRPAGHNLDISDLDGDGAQEVIAGGLCYGGDGTVRWEAEPFGHTDISKAAPLHPDYPGRQVFYAVESGNPGVYLVDNRGKTIFKEPFHHAHFGWVARHTTRHAGLQMHAAEDARRGDRQVPHNPVFLPDGSHWLNLTDWQRKNFVPVQWDAGPVTVFIVRKEHRLVRLLGTGDVEPVPPGDLPAGGVYGRNLCCVDILGDYREEVVTIDQERDELLVLTNTELNDGRGRSPADDFDYRHDRSQHGSGYYIYKPPPDLRVP